MIRTEEPCSVGSALIVAIRRFFFFSSRRRHTRLQGDWSSDVCSSDLCGLNERSMPLRRMPLGRCVRKVIGPISILPGQTGEAPNTFGTNGVLNAQSTDRKSVV